MQLTIELSSSFFKSEDAGMGLTAAGLVLYLVIQGPWYVFDPCCILVQVRRLENLANFAAMF
jgi:hypothetical protein